MATPPAVEDQARLLEDALTVVRQQTHLMRKCLETPGKLMDALKCRLVSLYIAIGFIPLHAHGADPLKFELVLIRHSSHLKLNPCIRAPNKQPGTEAILRTLHGCI